MAARIEDYGLIGDTKTSALVSKTGSIDWFCAPDFDSDACFAALLGYDQHGFWSIRPVAPLRQVRQYYDGETLVLVTEFTCDGGRVRIVDFMPINEGRTDLIRIIEGLDGEVPLEMILLPRFEYGSNAPRIRVEDEGISLVAGKDALRLRGNILPVMGEARVVSECVVSSGDKIELQLAWHPSHLRAPQALDVAEQREKTRAHWAHWAGRCAYHGRYREAVVRSLLTLKALTYSPTGAIIAAPTAGLPEEIGGSRNWDYRYCWLRDTSLTIHALLFGGYVEEASAFRAWLHRTVGGEPREMQIMYSIYGARRLNEVELAWLPGYEGSRPVRIGNGAWDQFQLDVYGEVISSLYEARRTGMSELSDGWPVARAILDHLEAVWQQPDDGIWEVRGGRRHFTHSKLMAWVAVDRSVRSIEEYGVGGEDGQKIVRHLCALRERIHEEICERGYNPRIGAFTQYYGGETLDASVLLMPHFQFLPASDARMRRTVEAIENALVRDGFVMRYSTEHGVDGLPGSEGAFLACSFWLADNYAFQGRFDRAEQLLERLLGLRNHLGLLAEEYEPRLQRQVGNFPQGFSHLALVTTVHELEQEKAKRRRRAAAE